MSEENKIKYLSEIERYELININDGEKYDYLLNNDLIIDEEGNFIGFNNEIWAGRTRTNKLVLWPIMGKQYTTGQAVNVEIISAQTWLLKGKAES